MRLADAVRMTPAKKVNLVLLVMAGVMAMSDAPRACSAGQGDGPSSSGAISARTTTSAAADDPRLAWLSNTLLWGSVILLVGFVSAGAILVFSRRFRSYLQAGTHNTPTPNEDAWSLHRLPHERDGRAPGEDDGDAGSGDDDWSPFGPDKSPPDEPSLE